MNPNTENNNYPVFEANQVLSSEQLNQVFSYLDEQERLTRANLIGIGIDCGLEIRYDPQKAPATIHLSKGCGITSEGYLIVQPEEDVLLTAYRENYLVPADLGYSKFMNAVTQKQYTLWELFPGDEPDTKPLGTPANFKLSDKAVLLFLELKKDGLRNCCPNNCDDKGSAVTATVRKLLIFKSDLDKIIAEAKGRGTGLSSSEQADALMAKLGLADIRLPRYDIPNSGPATSNDILTAFLAIFQSNSLAERTAVALTTAYEAFKPILLDIYPKDPFVETFRAKFGFLDKAPTTPAQVRFLQYYCDFFDDLLKAYDELRWKGVDMMCACCPPDGLFPRHLMLGALGPEDSKVSAYRQQFLASPAGNRCGDRTKEMKQLFQRLVEMIVQFTERPLALPMPPTNLRTGDDPAALPMPPTNLRTGDDPAALPMPPTNLRTGDDPAALPMPPTNLRVRDAPAAKQIDKQIRITPSKLGDVPQSDKAIPYYYRQDGVPPLYQLWNAEKTRRDRANQNLGYFSDKYPPRVPAFVTNPLAYDLEPFNFLRIEGHLGKNYRPVLETLLYLKSQYRLPIEIIALRTGAFDETISVDLSNEACRFQDLEAMYDTLKAELSCLLCKEVQFLYKLPVVGLAASDIKLDQPKLSLLVNCAPEFKVQSNTFGWIFEAWLAAQPEGVIPDIDRNPKEARANPLIYLIVFISKLSDQLSPNLELLNFTNFKKCYHNLLGSTQAIERNPDIIAEKIKLLNKDDLDDRLDDIIYNCRFNAVKSLYEEYNRRLREAKQKQFFSFFVEKNPGIQHKAGAPLGGTFILVYHDTPDQVKPGMKYVVKEAMVEPGTNQPVASEAEAATKAISQAISRLQLKTEMMKDDDVQLIVEKLTGHKPEQAFIPYKGGLNKDAVKIISETINGLQAGTVIADFFLPYLCCSDCTPIQYVLPAPPLDFDVQLKCTDPTKGTAEAALKPHGGKAPFTYQLDDQSFTELKGKLVLSAGSHALVLRDSVGAESAKHTITVPGPLTLGLETYTDISATTYQVSFNISGGTAPYKTDSGTVAGSTFTSKPVKSGDKISVTITDSVGCNIPKDFTHTVPCKLPCKGIALRRGYSFSLPLPDKKLVIDVPRFTFEYPQGKQIDLTKEAAALIKRTAAGADFNGNLAKQLNELIAKATGSDDWLIFNYSQPVSKQEFGLNTWEIEYFECLNFAFQIVWSNSDINNKTIIAPTTSITINPKGSSIKESQGNKDLVNIAIPAFNIIKIDKCDPKRPPEEICKKVDLTLEISKELGRQNLALSVTPSGKDAPATYLWEVQDGIPAWSSKINAKFKFTQSTPATKNIRLTAYTKNGCRVIATDKISLKASG